MLSNIFGKKHQSAKSKHKKSWVWWYVAGILTIFALVFGIPKLVFTTVADSFNTAAKKANEWSENYEKQAQQEQQENNDSWQKSLRREKVDSDSISITSSEDGEIVEVEPGV